MTSSDLFTATSTQLTKYADIIGGKPWGADKGKPRIYMPSRRDCKVYFDFPDFPSGDDSDLLGGSRFQCFIDDCGQHANWYASQKTKLLQAHYREGLALSALYAGDEQLARDVMELDEVDAATLGEAGGHLINGRIAEARTAIFG